MCVVEQDYSPKGDKGIYMLKRNIVGSQESCPFDYLGSEPCYRRRGDHLVAARRERTWDSKRCLRRYLLIRRGHSLTSVHPAVGEICCAISGHSEGIGRDWCQPRIREGDWISF